MTVPGPLPLQPDVTAIQGLSETADHEQPPNGVTWSVPRPPTASNDCEKGGVRPMNPQLVI